MMFKNVEEIRKALIAEFPNENDDEVSIEHSGFVHDSPMIAIGVVLISSIVLGTTDPVKLTQFTGYSERFVRGIANNLENSGLWKNGKYECSSWFAGDLIPNKEPERELFCEHIFFAAGFVTDLSTNIEKVQNTRSILWEDMLVEAQSRGVMMWPGGKRVL
jgi:hypothetical protein